MRAGIKRHVHAFAAAIDSLTVEHNTHRTISRGRLHTDFIARRVHIDRRFKARPRVWNTRVHHQKIALPANPQNALDSSPVHPSGRPRVPRPAAAPDMWRD